MYAIVGSHAGLFHNVVPKRTPKDWDILATQKGYEKFMKYKNFVPDKVEETEKGLTAFTECGNIVEVELAEKCKNIGDILDRILYDNHGSTIATPEWLYFLKMSHRYKKDSPHFWKTRLDIEYMRMKGVQFPKNSDSLFKERENLTYKNKLPNLNQGSNTFFKKEDGFYVYDHDSIHRAVAILEKPAYTYYMKDGAEVFTSKDKFFAVPEEIRMLGVYEESCVLALERSLIPFNFRPNPEVAFKMALSKVCTSITGGWFREYSWENCLKVMKFYKDIGSSRYVEKFKHGLNNSVILPFNKE